jgi:hypothetical protein
MQWQSESAYWQQGLGRKQQRRETDLGQQLSRRAFAEVFVLAVKRTRDDFDWGLGVMEVGSAEVVAGGHLVVDYVASVRPG